MFFTGKEYKRLHQFRELTGMAELLIAGVQTPSAHSADVLTGAHRFCSLNPLRHGYREGPLYPAHVQRGALGGDKTLPLPSRRPRASLLSPGPQLLIGSQGQAARCCNPCPLSAIHPLTPGSSWYHKSNCCAWTRAKVQPSTANAGQTCIVPEKIVSQGRGCKEHF